MIGVISSENCQRSFPGLGGQTPLPEEQLSQNSLSVNSRNALNASDYTSSSGESDYNWRREANECFR